MTKLILAFLPLILSSGAALASRWPSPHSCGFPDSTNTGPTQAYTQVIPDDATSGDGWEWDTRGYVRINGANHSSGPIIFQKKLVHGWVTTVDHSIADSFEITIKNNVIVPDTELGGTFNGDIAAVDLRPGSNKIIVTKNRVYPVGDCSDTSKRLGIGIGVTVTGGGSLPSQDNIEIDNNEVSCWRSGIQGDGGNVHGNHVYKPGFRTGDHTNAFTANNSGAQGGTLPALYVHDNTFENCLDQTDAISIFQDFGALHYITLSHNLLSGGSYAIYGGGGGSYGSDHIVIKGNVVARSTVSPDGQDANGCWNNGGFYGPAAHFDTNGTGNVWGEPSQPNKWDDTGASILDPGP